jgi:hypothetical protein
MSSKSLVKLKAKPTILIENSVKYLTLKRLSKVILGKTNKNMQMLSLLKLYTFETFFV